MTHTITIPVEEPGCETCATRHLNQLLLLAEVPCRVLEDVVCRDCGRTFTLIVEDS